MEMSQLTAVDAVCLLVWDLNAELLFSIKFSLRVRLMVGKASDYTSSIAITTSTVSKLSKPRSFAKCEVPLIFKRVRLFPMACKTLLYHVSSHTLEASDTCRHPR